jgi:hypothetical protein
MGLKNHEEEVDKVKVMDSNTVFDDLMDMDMEDKDAEENDIHCENEVVSESIEIYIRSKMEIDIVTETAEVAGSEKKVNTFCPNQVLGLILPYPKPDLGGLTMIQQQPPPYCSRALQDSSRPGPSPGTEAGPVPVSSTGLTKSQTQSLTRFWDWENTSPSPGPVSGTASTQVPVSFFFLLFFLNPSLTLKGHA